MLSIKHKSRFTANIDMHTYHKDFYSLKNMNAESSLLIEKASIPVPLQYLKSLSYVIDSEWDSDYICPIAKSIKRRVKYHMSIKFRGAKS